MQQYTLQPNSYVLDYSIEGKGIESNGAFIHWINYIDKLELGHRYEQQVSTVYYKDAAEDDADYCSCTSNDTDNLTGKNIQWLSHTNQFFNSALISKSGGFKDAVMSTEVIDFTKNDDLKSSVLILKYHLPEVNTACSGTSVPMNLKLCRRSTLDWKKSSLWVKHLWFTQPLGNQTILWFPQQFYIQQRHSHHLLIFLIKMMLYPLLYKMLHSQA